MSKPKAKVANESHSPRFLRGRYGRGILAGLAITLFAAADTQNFESDEPTDRVTPSVLPTRDTLVSAAEELAAGLEADGGIACPTDQAFIFQLNQDPGTQICVDTSSPVVPTGTPQVVFGLALTPTFEASHIFNLSDTLDALTPADCQELRERIEGFGEELVRGTGMIDEREIVRIGIRAELGTSTACDTFRPPLTSGPEPR